MRLLTRQFSIGNMNKSGKSGLIALVLIAACAHSAGIAWPFDWLLPRGQPVWWLQLLALAVLARQLDAASTKREGAWLGWLFACVMQTATWWWLYVSLHTYGGLAAPLAVLAIVGLAAFLALYYAAVCSLFVAIAPANRAGRATVFATLWLLAELCRVALFTGFPWGEGGYAQLDGPLIGLASITGVHGLTLVSAWLAFFLVARRGRAGPGPLGSGRLGAVLLVLAVLCTGMIFNTTHRNARPPAASQSKPQPAPFTVALLQGNIAQDEKFQPSGGIPDALNWYQSELLAATASLVVTPETALPILPDQLPEGYLKSLKDRFMNPASGTPQTAALIGIPLGSSQDGYTNSVIGITPGGQQIYQYDKHHLVPFGEFVHPLFKWFLRIVNIPLSDFNRGAVNQPSLIWQGQRIAPNICYEDLFGEELAARFVNAIDTPTIMVNISNIGWFGNTIAIDQHLNISRMRSLEFSRPMVRATNTGATAIIDHTGRVTQLLARHTRGVLVGPVEGRSEITPYAWWAARFGLWPWWALILTIFLIAAGARIDWSRASKDTR